MNFFNLVLMLVLVITISAQRENISYTNLAELLLSTSTKAPPSDPLQRVMHKFNLYEHEVSPLMKRLDSVGQTVKWLRHVFSPRRTLLVIDMQNDFITGTLAVDDAEDIVNPIAELTNEDVWNQVIYSQDWHPNDHISFFSNVDSRPLDPTWLSEHPGKVTMFEEVVFRRYPPYAQVLWPDHCVQESDGANFHPNITSPKKTKIIQKGTNPMIDSYSAFFDNTGIKGSGSTGLKEMVKGSTEIVVVGLAMDYCVGYTSLHSLELGYPTTLLRDMTRPVKIQTGEDMLAKVRNEGGQVTTWNSWRKELEDWQRAKDVAEFFIANTGVLENMSFFTTMALLAFTLSM
eukprot:TRINITY_DN1369_c0_g1_i1.p1 TRINITY_DN1369_c0_g1~~TRINITY_DN1369_c0_g1_i1.p1  ORF type:complete len:345 (+),score=73.63 TRINITY_DN1369_c0_g1_i1:291-1325(+)